MRLFIAIKLPEGLIEEIRRFQLDLAGRLPADAIKWVQPEQIHLTLCFLGEVEDQNAKGLGGLLGEIARFYRPIRLRPQGLSGFPSLQRPRVIFIGLTGELNLLQSLAEQVRREIGPLGSHHEDREFHPHLTLGRVTKRYSSSAVMIGAKLQRVETPVFSPWIAQEIYLIQSILKPTGPEYRDVYQAKLAALG